jgi:transposase
MKKYIVRLTQEERNFLIQITRTGKHAAAKILHAKILLEADVGQPDISGKADGEIAKLLQINISTVHRVREKLVTEGLQVALERKKYPSRAIKMSGDEEAHLIALCCSKAPEGRARWTLTLLADALVQMEIFDSVSSTTVWRALKKTS